MEFVYGKLTGADVSTGFVALKRFVNFFQEYISAIILTELTSISAGLHSGGSIGGGLRSDCSCLGEACCCFILDQRRLLGGPSTSVGAAGVVVSSVGSCCCHQARKNCLCLEIR